MTEPAEFIKGWQPIATAPKDGTNIIVSGGIAHWYKNAWHSLTGFDYPGRPIEWPVHVWMSVPIDEALVSSRQSATPRDPDECYMAAASVVHMLVEEGHCRVEANPAIVAPVAEILRKKLVREVQPGQGGEQWREVQSINPRWNEWDWKILVLTGDGPAVVDVSESGAVTYENGECADPCEWEAWMVIPDRKQSPPADPASPVAGGSPAPFKVGERVTTHPFTHKPNALARFHNLAGNVTEIDGAGNYKVHGEWWHESFLSKVPETDEHGSPLVRLPEGLPPLDGKLKDFAYLGCGKLKSPVKAFSELNDLAAIDYRGIWTVGLWQGVDPGRHYAARIGSEVHKRNGGGREG